MSKIKFQRCGVKHEMEERVKPKFKFVLQKEYKGIKVSEWIHHISEGRGERTCVKNLSSLKWIPNHPSKSSIQLNEEDQ